MMMQFKNMCVKELLPADLLESLMCTKGRAFWDLVTGISFPLRFVVNVVSLVNVALLFTLVVAFFVVGFVAVHLS